MTAPVTAPSAPQMSIILVTDHYRTIREVITRLREQTVRDRLEIVLVAPEGHSLELDAAALDGFSGVRLVEVESILPLGSARAAGVRAATAPLIVIGETHSYPHRQWAEALIKTHAEPWAVVVPAFGNANPDGALSWAAFMRDYGRWVDGLPAGEIDLVPAYNTAAKRDVLLEFGGGLERMVTHGDELEIGLRERGHRVYFQPAAKIDHANVARPAAWLVQRFLIGRVFAAGRAERWPTARRVVYTIGAPLIPVVVLSRLARSIRLLRRQELLPGGTILAMILGLVASAAGEMVTYAIGGGKRDKLRLDEYELHKIKYTYLPAQ